MKKLRISDDSVFQDSLNQPSRKYYSSFNVNSERKSSLNIRSSTINRKSIGKIPLKESLMLLTDFEVCITLLKYMIDVDIFN